MAMSPMQKPRKPERRVGVMPSMLDAPPISGSNTPYRHKHGKAGYGADSFFNTDDNKKSKKADENERDGDGGLTGFGLQSIESVELLEGFHDSPGKGTKKSEKEKILPEAALMLYDTDAQDDILDYRDVNNDPILNIDPLANTVDRDDSPRRRHRSRGESRSGGKRGESRDRDSPERSRSDRKKEKSRRHDRDDNRDRDHDRDRRSKSRGKSRDRSRPKDSIEAADEYVDRSDPLTVANLGYMQKLTAEDKARRRVQARLDRRYKASAGDVERRKGETREETEHAEKEYMDTVHARDKQNMLTFATAIVGDGVNDTGLNDRDKYSLNESHRDHYRHAKRSSKRHRDEQKEALGEMFLHDRRGPGDRSVSNLHKERPVESAIFRHGLMILPNEDNDNIPKLNLAYDAHDYDEVEPVRIRVANKPRQANRMMPLVADDDMPMRPISREMRSNLLGDATERSEASDGVGPLMISPKKWSPSKAAKPTQGPGARMGMGIQEFPTMEDSPESSVGSPNSKSMASKAKAADDDDGVEVMPMQKYPMWTT